MKHAFLSVGLCGLISMIAVQATAEPVAQPVWADGVPDSNGLSGPEIGGNCIGNISVPTYTVYLPPKDKATGAAVVIFPGGGYRVVCMGSEGGSIAAFLNERGIAGIVVKYRLPNKHHEIPANDARRVIRTVRANAKEWNVDPKRVGVMGFSAGGHLASTVTTVFDAGDSSSSDLIEQQSSRPDFSILFYPVISMEKGVPHGGTRKNLFADESLVERYSNEKRVSAETPPTFMLHCSDDRSVPVENTLRFYRALVAHKIPATCMIYEKGGHGPNAFKGNPSWEASLDAWFRARGCIE